MIDSSIVLDLDGLPINHALNFIGAILDEQKAIDRPLIWGVKLNTLLLHDGCHLITLLKKNNVRVMADVKLFHNPQAMRLNINLLESAQVDIITLHCASNFVPDLELSANKLAGVTILTSMNQEQCLYTYGDTVENMSLKFAKNALDNKYGYLMCSAQELKLLKSFDIKKICTGIRPSWYSGPDDQERCTTPQEAIREGASLLVIGRPIILAKNPLDALLHIMEDIDNIATDV